MKALIATFLLVFITIASNAQDTAISTFHIQHEAQIGNGIAFSYGCKGDHRDVFISNDGTAIFRWGGNANNTSASFTGDTVTINVFKNIITAPFIDSLSKVYTNDHRCGYFMRILQDGRVINGVIIDDYMVADDMKVPPKLSVLIKLLNDLYKRYSFPK